MEINEKFLIFFKNILCKYNKKLNIYLNEINNINIPILSKKNKENYIITKEKCI